MLRLRKEQIEVLKSHMRDEFVDRMVNYLRGKYPNELEKHLGEGAWNGEVKQLVYEGMEKAGSYDIKSERDVAGFLELMVMTERNFDKSRDYAWANRILIDPALPASGKVELIHERLKFRSNKGNGNKPPAAGM